MLRTERGMERKDLAEAAGLSYAYLSEIETGKKRGSSKALYVIAEALGVRPSEILVLGDRYASQPAGRIDRGGVADDPRRGRRPRPRPAGSRVGLGASAAHVRGRPTPARADSAPAPVAAQRAPGSGRWQWFQREAPMQRAAAMASDAGEPDPRAALLQRLGDAAANLSGRGRPDAARAGPASRALKSASSVARSTLGSTSMRRARLRSSVVLPLLLVAAVGVGAPKEPQAERDRSPIVRPAVRVVAHTTVQPRAIARVRGGKPGSVTISFVGDSMFGDTPDLPPHPAHYLDNVRKALGNAQIVFGNLEGTLTTATASKCGANPSPNCFDFRVPPRYGGYLRHYGFDVLNSANNHAHDFGSKGVSQTSAALRRHEIRQTGLPGQVAVLDAGETSVAFVGFAPYSNTCNLLDFPAARALIHRADDAADLVVVYMHAGAEGADKTHVTGREEYAYGEDRGNPKRFAHMAVANGADLVLASGPHVLRGIEFSVTG